MLGGGDGDGATVVEQNVKIICDSSFVIGNYFVTLRR